MSRVFKSLVLDPVEVARWKENIRRYDCPPADTTLYALHPHEAMAEVRAASRPLNDVYLHGSLVAQATTPSAVTDTLAAFGLPGGPDAVLIDLGREFVEIDPAQHMPVGGLRNPQKPFGADEIALLGIVQATGFPFSLIPEAGLDLFMPVSPTPGRETTRSSKGGARLGWHVDNLPFARPYRPDFLALMGLVSSEPVATSFALVDDVLVALRQHGTDHERTLSRPLFRYATPASFHFDGSPPVLSDPMPVIEEDASGRTVLNFNEYTLVADGGDPEIAAALAALNAVLGDDTVVREERVSPGKVLLLSNTRALHARGEVRGTRYLNRLYGKRDLSALRALRSGGDRVCRFRFMLTPDEVVAACRRPGPSLS